MKLLATNVQSVVIPDTGHWVAEESPDQLLAALTPFLAPYRAASAAAHTPGPHAVAASRYLGWTAATSQRLHVVPCVRIR
jgi:hypothetical protein